MKTAKQSIDLEYKGTKKRLNLRTALISLCMFAFVGTSAQTGTVTVKLRNASVKELFSAIEKQTSYRFSYRDAEIKGKGNVTISATNRELKQLLEGELSKLGLKYAVSGNKIIVTPAAAVPSAQPKKVTGKVVDTNGEPVIGATVKEQGTANGTITDFDGNFTLDVTDNAMLEVSYIGYKSQELKAVAGKMLSVTLSEDTEVLDEVVVVGYGVQKKSTLTGAISSVKADELVATSDASIGQLLKGKAAGVTILSTSAQPGGGLDIRIRGASSTGAGNEPLFVIDGFPISGSSLEPGGTGWYDSGSRNPLNSLNPNDIESIEILKDASSTAIYGARASNGVVLITTKRGKQGIKFNYDANITTQKISNPFDVLNAHDFMVESNKMIKEKWMRDNGVYPYGNNDPSSIGSSWTPKYTDEQIAEAGEGTDWWDLVTRTGIVHNHNISMTYGNDKIRSYASLGYFKNEGVVENTSLERFTAKINLDWNINKFLSTGVSYLGSRISTDNVQGGNGEWAESGMLMTALLFDPTLPVRDENGNYCEMNDYSDLSNPVSFKDVYDKTQKTRTLINFYLKLTPIKNLEIRTSAGYDGESAVRKIYMPHTFKKGSQQGGQAVINQNNRNDILFDITASYHLKKEMHSFDIMAGYSYQQFNGDNYGMTGRGYFTDAFGVNNIGLGEKRPDIGSGRYRNVLASYFGRINYSFMDRYLLTINFRYDGADKFGRNNRWAFFPSASVGWRVSEEEFMKGLENLSNLKLRLSYGQTGNSNISSNAFSFYDANRRYPFNSNENKGVTLTQLENPNLKWETSTEFNVGLDFGVFKNRISGTFEYYRKVTSDLLGWRNLRSWNVVSGISDNLGKTQSHGIELTLNTVNILTKNFKWTTDFTFTRYVDKWKERSADVTLQPWEKVDDYIRPIYSYVSDGIVQIGENVPHMPYAVPGNLKIKDINGFDENMNYIGAPDGKIDEADIVYLGKWDPDFSIGFNNTFKYRDFDLSIFAYGSFNQMAFNESKLKFVEYSEKMLEHGTNLSAVVKDRWSSDNPNGTLPSEATNSTMGADCWLWEKASFLRVKNITLGYKMPSSVLGKLISNLRFYINIENPFIITNWDGMDPETDSSGKAPYPNQRSYSFGFNLEF